MEVKFKMGSGDLPAQEQGSIIIDTLNEDLWIDTNDNKRIQINGIALDGKMIKKVVGVDITIDDEAYILLAVKKS